jgi:RNA polymerase sigma-70 factor (ECF subfamily)
MAARDQDGAELRTVQLAAAGDQAAQAALFERYRAAAYAVAFRITGRVEDALDVVQDSFIAAFTRLGEFQQESTFKTWLLRIVTNKALDALRARRLRVTAPLQTEDGSPLPLPAQDASDPAETRDLAEKIHAALEKLPPDQRAVFALFAQADMTYGQIAETLGIPVGTVMSRLYHARRRLLALLSDLAPPGRPADREG